jgi:hypothetical protein
MINNIFDPLNIIIKLCILSKKEIGTKISIKNYIIEIQDKTFFQGFFRCINYDKKEDLERLLYPIIIACEKYLKNNYIKYNKIFRYSLDGVNKLLYTYNNNLLIENTLKYIILIINYYLNNNNEINNINEINIKQKNDLLLYFTNNMDNINKLYNNNFIAIIDKTWDYTNLLLLINLVDIYIKSNLSILTQELIKFINSMDILFINYMIEYNNQNNIK